ncbi:MAG: PilZ domain-containing protein [Candidatus Sulfopaludibacter sp.]|nr:PilZ domain-containing protein [Candidatus Sulfopaludibacter sp.]
MVRPSEKLERRTKARFPIHRELRYKVLDDDTIVAAGVGKTVDISSSGLAFDIDQTVKPGAFIELSISWPVLLDENCGMRLIVFGRVLRSGPRKTVCTIDKYEFRTQARVFQAAVPTRTDSMLQRWADGYRRETLKTREVAV